MSAWISKVFDFVNLGKVVVDAGPGIVLAIALAILCCGIVGLPLLPYETMREQIAEAVAAEEEEEEAEPEEKPPGGKVGGEAAAAAGAVEEEGEGSIGEVDHDRSTYSEIVAWLEGKVTSARREVRRAAGTAAEKKAEIARREAERTERDGQRRTLEEARLERIKRDQLGDGRLKDAIEELKGDNTAVNGDGTAVSSLAVLRRQLAEAEEDLAASTTAFERWKSLLDRVRSQQIVTLNDLFAYLLDHLIGLALVGWVLGTLMNPINRGLVLLGRTRLVGTVQENKARTFVSRVAPERSADFLELVTTHEPSYFIGREIVARSEIDELISSYYRWAEASINLVIPVLALGGVLSWVLWRQDRVGSGVLLMTVTALAVAALARRGRKGYADYKVRLTDFLLGRLEKVAYAERKAELAETLEKRVTAVIRACRQHLEALGTNPT